MTLEFGIAENFERLERVPPAQQYADRIALIRQADEAGLYGYHVSEHHNNVLGLAPSPLVFLSAVAQRTTRIRLGSLVLILPTYLPFRLLEEICMVDQLSGGRLMIGVGRGVRPVEHEWMGLDPAEGQERFGEALELLRHGLRGGRLSHAGRHHHLEEVELRFEPFQRPHPPLWYAGNLEAAAALGMSVIGVPWHGMSRERIDAYWDAFARASWRETSPWTETEPKVGTTRHVVVAETDAEAVAITRRAWRVHADNVWTVPFGIGSPAIRGTEGMNVGEDADVVLPRRRALLAGSPETVADALAEFLEDVGPGHNYLVANVQWGDIGHEEASRSLELYAAEVMPALGCSRPPENPVPAGLVPATP
jgi:alkanesulfonate monooxygenase SsuD/methylene tetrahydromethanopterin reductase-like flavin-dependent oxidoreductase (luciferase family)